VDSDDGGRHRRAIASAVGLYGLFLGLHVLLAWDAGAVVRAVAPGIGAWLGPVCWAAYTLFALASVALVGMGRTGLIGRPAPGSWRLTLVPVAAGLPFLLFGVNISAGDVLPLLVVGVPLIALNEELVYRGVLLPLLRPLGWRRAVLWSSVAFGASHLVNLVSGAYPPFVAMQVAATTCGGIALAAIRIRSGSLWPVLGAHAAIDVMAVATLTGPATSSPILVPVLFGWLFANLALWRYGWRLLAGRDDAELDRLAAGRAGADAAPALRPATGASGRPYRGTPS
jgi:membrane protease YdiL (CAAX protease family)